jgi:hypothetical protein
MKLGPLGYPDNRIIRDHGSFVADGFEPGMVVVRGCKPISWWAKLLTWLGLRAPPRYYRVTDVTPTTMYVLPLPWKPGGEE